MQLAQRCLDCPLARGDAFGLVIVALSLLLFGRVLLAIPRRLLRGFGLVGLGAALVLHAFGLSAVALVGIAWGAPGRLRDALFSAGWLAASACILAAGARIGRAFPHRSARLQSLPGGGRREHEPRADRGLEERRRLGS